MSKNTVINGDKDKASVASCAEPCPICLESYTKSVRKQVSCQYCHESVCSKCLEKYLLNTIEDPHCMHCRKGWTRGVLGTMVTKTFINNTYFKYRQDILLNREKSFIPQFQMHAEREKRARDLEKENDKITIEYNKIMAEYNKAIAVVQNKRSALYRRISRIRAGLDEEGTTHEVAKQKEVERQKFVRRCTAEGCKGFLSSVWKCGLCNVWVCPDCFEVKGDNKDADHTCKKENLETAALIKKDTKPCPTCGEIIMKTEGCFAKDTPILMWNGTTKMSQDICVGDELVGDDGNKRIVIDTFNGVDKMYEVKQNSGMTYIVNSKHTLVLKYAVEGQPIEIIVDDYIKLSDIEKNRLYGYNLNGVLMKIAVIDIGMGQYFGWRINENNRFLLNDKTCVKNCSQMWCTSCHNAFDWNTGKVVTTGTIHNPHYFQWLQKGGKVPENPRNIPCGGLPDGYNMRRKLQNVTPTELARFMEIYRICAHVIDVERHRYERHLTPLNNQDIGIKYMLNELSEEDWKRELAKREKDRQKSNEIRDILDAFNGATIDVFRRIDVYSGSYTKEQQEDLVKTIITELTGLRQFTMDAMCEVSKSFNCSIPMVTPDWKVVHGKYTILQPGKKRVAKKDDKEKEKKEKPANAGAGKAESDSDSDYDSD
jgi:hypothetical protein